MAPLSSILAPKVLLPASTDVESEVLLADCSEELEQALKATAAEAMVMRRSSFFMNVLRIVYLQN
jgi:uncharacterized protein YbjT (DUF2867 family)